MSLPARNGVRADFDDTPTVRSTTGVTPGTEVAIQVDDSEWAQTILLVDDDSTDSVLDPLDVSYSQDEQPSYRLFLQGLHNIGYSGAPTDDCPAALVAGEINLWDTNFCAASPSDALLAEADIVIWYTAMNGPFFATPTLSAAEVTSLDTYLDAGGSLFLESVGYLQDVDSCLGASPYTSPVPSPGCISAANSAFITTYLGVDQFTVFDRTVTNTRLLTYDPVTGDTIADAGEPLSLQIRRRAIYQDIDVLNLSTTATSNGVLEDNDASFGGTLAADENFVMTRTDDGTARVVFTTRLLENQYNQADPDNVRTLFERAVRYLADAPTVTVTNERTSESETIDLSNSGLGVATGTVGTTLGSCPCATGDSSMVVQPGDQLVVTYTQTSPAATSVTSTTTIVDTSPLSFTDSGGTALTTIPVPGNLYVQLNDADQNTSAAAQSLSVTVSSDLGDSEAVTLTETGGTTNVFRSAALPTDLNDTTADNGTLGVADGGTVSASYAFLGAEQTKTFTQTAWQGGETDGSTSVDTTGFDEHDDQTAINASENGYFVIDDPDNLQTDWVKNNFPPQPNPQIVPYTGFGTERFDNDHAYASAVVREPATGDYYMWYTGEDSTALARIGLARSLTNTLAPVGREFIKYPDNETYTPVIDPDTAPAGSWWECGASAPTVAINPNATLGNAEHFIMLFAGLGGGAVCGDAAERSRIGRATSADGITWTVDADPISETVAGAPLEAPFNAGGDFNPSVIYEPLAGPAAYRLWFDNGTLIQYTQSATGAAGTWSVPTTALNVSATGDEWDDVSVTAPSVVFDISIDNYVMYYEGNGTPCGDPNLFLPAIGRAAKNNPAALFDKPVAPAEQAGLCGEKDGGIPGPPDAPTYENIVLRAPEVFTFWDTTAQDPMLLLDPTDNIDRLWFNSPTEGGQSIGLAWNIESDPDGTLHSNPIDTDSAGFTTVGFGPLTLTHLGHDTVNLSARSSDSLADLLFDPAPDLAYPAGSPFLTNGALLSDFTGVSDGERYLQYRAELEQDQNPGTTVFETPPANFVFTDAVEEISLQVYQREDLAQTLSVPAELAATDAVVRITDATFTLDPTEQEVTYDLTSALDESTKRVVDPNGGELLPGDQLDYSIMVRNSASIPLTQVVVRDEVPLGTTYLAGSIFGTGADDSAEPSLVWNLGTLDPGESETIGFSVIVRDDVGQGSEILNQAFINSAETGVIPTENPTTEIRRDATIIAVGAKFAILLAGAAVLAAIATALLGHRRRRRKALQHKSPALLALLALMTGWLIGFIPTAQAQSPGNDIYFEVQDGDQNLDPTVIDTVVAEVTTSSGDRETVTLAESDVDTGVFRATRRAVLDPVQIPDNNLLEVEPNDTVTLAYEDVFNTTGQTQTVTDSVTIITRGDPFTISVIALRPRLLPGGGLEADILASPRDPFGVPLQDGTPVEFDSSVGSVDPTVADTQKGVAQTLFTSPTIINPSVISASVGTAQQRGTGSVSLVTNVDTSTTSSTNNVPINQPGDINVPGPTNNAANNTTNEPPSNTISNQINNTPRPIEPVEPPVGQPWYDSPLWNRIEEVTDRIINPITVGATALNLVLAATVTNWYPLLLRIFLEPAQVFFGRRRKSWGVVYNSLTKQPIDLAIVRLLRPDGSLVTTKVTDRFGRYGFLVPPGTYRIAVTKPTYTYPSALLSRLNSDESYKDLYYGSEFTLTKETFVNYNIPIDPPEARASVATVLRRYFKNATHRFVAYIGLVVGFFAVLIAHTWLSVALLGLHLLVFAIFWRIARGRRSPRWGIVYDRQEKKPLGYTVVRIYDAKYNRVLEQQVADRSGRFGFLVGKSTYYLDAIKPGYTFPPERKGKLTDYIGGFIRTSGAEASVAVDVPLDKAKPGEPAIRAPLNPQAPSGPIAPSTPAV